MARFPNWESNTAFDWRCTLKKKNSYKSFELDPAHEVKMSVGYMKRKVISRYTDFREFVFEWKIYSVPNDFLFFTYRSFTNEEDTYSTPSIPRNPDQARTYRNLIIGKMSFHLRSYKNHKRIDHVILKS